MDINKMILKMKIMDQIMPIILAKYPNWTKEDKELDLDKIVDLYIDNHPDLVQRIQLN